MTTSIKHSQRTFQSDFGKVAYDLYEPALDVALPVRIIQIAHGMVEHKGRYCWVAHELAKNGYIVAISDHRGHGESVNVESKITLGEMGEDGFQKAAYDLYKLNCTLKELYPKAEIILLGHSMGSLLARRYLLLYGDSICALILSGTPAYNPLLPLGIWLGRAFGFFDLAIVKNLGAKVLNRLSFGGFNKKLLKHNKMKRKQTPSLDSAKANNMRWLCSDNQVVQEYITDPKCDFIFSLQSFLNLFHGTQEVYSPNYPEPKNPLLPVLFVSGYDDACGDFGEGVQKARIHLQTQGYKDVEIILYQDARHEILNEPHIKQQVIQDILLWLRDRLK